MERFNFEYITGQRLNSKLIYVPEQKQLYKKRLEYKNKTYYICHKQNCKSKMEVFNNSDFIEKSKKFIDHNHADQESKYNEFKVLNTIKNQCVDSASMLSDVNALGGIRNTYRRVCEK